MLIAVATGLLILGAALAGFGFAVDDPAPVRPNASASEPLDKGRNAPIPSFSDPTAITNPWFPISDLGGYDLVGTEEGKPYRADIVLLERTKSIEWAGGTTKVAVARHRAYLDGELTEVAYDYFAQGDDGGVWYFGEAVDNYENGKVDNHEGAWLAGRDGALPGLLIPGKPRVGQVFWSEDFPSAGIVERDEVTRLDARVRTPAGTRADGMLVRAKQDDGTMEEKIYVPGLGVVFEDGPDSTLRLVR
ncbi:MAG: hypothetical protein ACRDV1_01895 [Actinomycetes bacterium]